MMAFSFRIESLGKLDRIVGLDLRLSCDLMTNS